MLLDIKNFREVCKTISTAVDEKENATNLELKVKDNKLYLSVTNKEYFTSVKYDVTDAKDFRAVVKANLFLNLISGITTDTIDITVDNNILKIRSGKSSYKLPMIYENDQLMELPAIWIDNKTVEMSISNDILKSILNVNGKELIKLKTLDNVSELNKLYYLTDEGCFTVTNGACLNSFTLEKPIKILLNDRIIKLFKLFKDDVHFSLGYDATPEGFVQTKVIFETDTIYLAAKIANDDILLTKIAGPYEATKNYIKETYKNNVVISANILAAAISRIMLFTKNSVKDTNMLYMPATINISQTELTITDFDENTETVSIENESTISEDYTMKINLADIKLVLDSCKDEHITLNCGNRHSVIITHQTVSNLIPECTK